MFVIVGKGEWSGYISSSEAKNSVFLGIPPPQNNKQTTITNNKNNKQQKKKQKKNNPKQRNNKKKITMQNKIFSLCLPVKNRDDTEKISMAPAQG